MPTNKSKLENLIQALEACNQPNNKILRDVISILKNKSPKEKAKIENDDNVIAGYIYRIFSILHDEVEFNNKFFISLCKKINPDPMKIKEPVKSLFESISQEKSPSPKRQRQ